MTVVLVPYAERYVLNSRSQRNGGAAAGASAGFVEMAGPARTGSYPFLGSVLR